MTKYSIKIRRNKLTKGKIESHKDFRALQQMSVKKQHNGNTSRLIAIIIATLMLIAMMFFGIRKVNDRPERVPAEEVPDVFDEFKH